MKVIKDPYLISFIINITSTITGGVLLAIIFFISKEKIFKYHDVSGKWYIEIKTKETAYDNYKDMILVYELFLWREGNQLYGTTEKSYENSKVRKQELTEKQRTRGKVNGVYEKNYLSSDMVNIHIHEFGARRESSYFLKMKVKKKLMKGTFISFIAKQKGEAVCTRIYSYDCSI